MEKEEILEYLKRYGRISISSLAVKLGIHYYKMKGIVDGLKKENKIKIINNRHYTYLDLK